MKGKSVHRVDDEGGPGHLPGQSAQDATFGVVGVENIVAPFFEDGVNLHQGLKVLEGVDGMYQVPDGDEGDAVFLDEVFQSPARGAGEVRLVSEFYEALNGEKGVDSRTADERQDMEVEDFGHEEPRLGADFPAVVAKAVVVALGFEMPPAPETFFVEGADFLQTQKPPRLIDGFQVIAGYFLGFVEFVFVDLFLGANFQWSSPSSNI